MAKIIADLCANHMGNIDIAETMIKSLSDIKVDYIKVQSWEAKSLVNQKKDDVEYYNKVQLSDDDHIRINEICDENKIGMLCTCFSLNRINFLSKLGLSVVKVASPDLTSYRMIDELTDKFEEVIVSTAGATDRELDFAIDKYIDSNVTFMHCNPYYPTPFNKVNMNKLINSFINRAGYDVSYGYSDHTLGTYASKYAICLGCKYVEKHFTLNRHLPGRDQSMSTTIDEFEDIVHWKNVIDVMNGDDYEIDNEYENTYRKKYIGKWGNNQE